MKQPPERAPIPPDKRAFVAGAAADLAARDSEFSRKQLPLIWLLKGYLYVEGRADDMVVVGGENVYPAEIEEVIRGIEGVLDVAVAGVEDPEYGQTLAAFVSGTADPKEIEQVCRDELASFKVPRRIEQVDELPRTSTGKVLRRKLIADLAHKSAS